MSKRAALAPVVFLFGVAALLIVAPIVAPWWAGPALAFVLVAAAGCVWRRRRSKRSTTQPGPTLAAPAAVTGWRKPQPTDTRGLVDEMLSQGRYALLMKAQLHGNLSDSQRRRVREQFESQMVLVPAGEVEVSRFAEFMAMESADAEVMPFSVEMVESFYLDRFAVTNRQFLEFISDGGYRDPTIWKPEVWPAVGEFVDSEGCPGPRFWRGGYPEGEDELPVVGVTWFEADAYACWSGKRLPCDAEWLKAAGCPVTIGPGTLVQRRFPWGDSMDRERCNVWGSGGGDLASGPAPVNAYSGGVALGGVYQLIGNVWEWTSDDLDPGDPAKTRLILPSPLKSLRGGAFDTYFDHQASSRFQSGENPMARKHNIGFRCAAGAAEIDGPTAHTGAAHRGAGAQAVAAGV